MTMMAAVLFSLYAVFDTTVRVFELADDRLEAAENARLGMGRMEREIRAAYPQAGGVLLGTWEPTRIAFQNKPTDEPPETIVYSVSGGSSGSGPPGRGRRCPVRVLQERDRLFVGGWRRGRDRAGARYAKRENARRPGRDSDPHD
jgi:type II secretory pathway component PulJ